jgi:thiol-disulfide isomerase/thioredoxin
MENYQIDFETRNEYFEFIKSSCITHNVIVKFTAEWCSPCKLIKDYCLIKFIKLHGDENICIEVDVDNSFDIYAFLKQKKMIQGIPTLFLYKKGKDNYIPDSLVSGTEESELNYFFNNI